MGLLFRSQAHCKGCALVSRALQAERSCARTTQATRAPRMAKASSMIGEAPVKGNLLPSPTESRYTHVTEIRHHVLADLLQDVCGGSRSVREVKTDMVHAAVPQSTKLLDEDAVAGPEAQKDGRWRRIRIFDKIDVQEVTIPRQSRALSGCEPLEAAKRGR